jgi:hypothetical protein
MVLEKALKEVNLTLEDVKKGNIPDDVADKVEEALVEAAYASREVVSNFGLHGTNALIRQYARGVPFMQGGIQGVYREARMAKDQPGAVLLRWSMYVLPITLAAWALSHKHDKYRDMPSESRDRYWWFPCDKDGMIWFAAAKPYFYGMLPAGLLERFLDWGINQDDANRRKPFEEIVPLLVKTFGFPVTSMAGDTILGLIANENYFGTPIVPQREQGLTPEMQYGTGTTQTAMKLAQALAILTGESGPSPRQIDYFVKGIFGGVGSTAMKAIDKLIPGEAPGGKRDGAEYAPLIGGLIYGPGEGGSRITDKFYKDYDYAQKLYASAKAWEKQGIKPTRKITERDVALVKLIPAMRAISNDLSDKRGELRDIVASKEYTPEQKRIATLRVTWICRVAAGSLYAGVEPPPPPAGSGLTDADGEKLVSYYRNLAEKAISNAKKKPGGPL